MNTSFAGFPYTKPLKQCVTPAQPCLFLPSTPESSFQTAISAQPGTVSAQDWPRTALGEPGSWSWFSPLLSWLMGWICCTDLGTPCRELCLHPCVQSFFSERFLACVPALTPSLFSENYELLLEKSLRYFLPWWFQPSRCERMKYSQTGVLFSVSACSMYLNLSYLWEGAVS